MEIISHRGYWKDATEKNKLIAFKNSFLIGTGTETDFRDYKGELVISHDIPTSENISVKSFFELYKSFNDNVCLAINIKADGLQRDLKKLLSEYNIENYFTFDMSIPDTIGYIKENIKFFSRQSEYEAVPAFYEDATGIWLDAFISNWYSADLIYNHLNNNKKVAIVSPELHKRSYFTFWEYLKKEKIHKEENVVLCTDYPKNAKAFFS